MEQKKMKIIWTKTDEAPALATQSLLPILRSYCKNSGIEFAVKDISLAGRILAEFSDYLSEDQRKTNDLEYLANLVKEANANIIKLPNISASIAQLTSAIKELQDKGYNVPDYPVELKQEEDEVVQNRYAKVLGSAVNPVLREGNSDRRAAVSVKNYAKKNPHKMTKQWPENSKTHIAYMQDGDFYGSEKSVVVSKDCNVKIEYIGVDGSVVLLKEKLSLIPDEIIDASVMSFDKLTEFFKEQIADAKKNDLLFSLHLKATMMKVSDPMIYGCAVKTFFDDVYNKYEKLFSKLGITPDNALVDIYDKIGDLPDKEQKEIKEDITKVYEKRPHLAMVDSDKGITNLHATNNIIIDASIPVVVRDGGRMWGPDGKLADTKAVIPDRCYATIYQAVIEDCQENGAFDPATMGSVSNVGLMAQKAEEYGSHDKTFKSPGNGEIRVIDEEGNILLSHTVEKNDIFRMCQTKDIPVQDWIKLAVKRARKTGDPAVFWLDENRGHDKEIITKVKKYLPDHNIDDLDILIMEPYDAMKFTVDRVRQGKNTISVTGNILRDYLTDLFPILELGTSAKMLSIVPLINGGGLFETGAGGSAPKHMRQFVKEGHLRWDSLGEYCALTASFEHLGNSFNNEKAVILAETLDKAIAIFLENEKSPSRKVNEPDNRNSNFYLALYWAKALAEQNKDEKFKNRFAVVYKKLSDNENKINKELLDTQGKPVDLGGYYMPDKNLLQQVMCPSRIFNMIIREN